jgi:hypothetical protein
MDLLCCEPVAVLAPVTEVPALRAAIRASMDMLLAFVLMIMVRLLYLVVNVTVDESVRVRSTSYEMIGDVPVRLFSDIEWNARR